jgi:pyruvate/2-oxoglutarate dehydrogenase complex dihydrolipoamide acyltransferase (E2) component
MPQVTMPQLGEGVEEGTIGKWLKSVGDHVRVGDPLVEVVTDKVNAEVPSPFEGTLSQILVSEGDTVSNDVPIAEVEASGVAATPDAAPAEEAASTAAAADAAEAEATAPAAANSATGAAANSAAKLELPAMGSVSAASCLKSM